MAEKQIDAALSFLAGWLGKTSVGCLLVGMFQPDHIFGGIIGCVIAFILAGSLKNLGGKMNFNFAMGCVIALSFIVFGIGLYLIHLKKKIKQG